MTLPPIFEATKKEVLIKYPIKSNGIAGVVGVYVGRFRDDKPPCLKVMVIKETEELKKRILNSIVGYPVVIEEPGVIRPLKGRIPSHS